MKHLKSKYMFCALLGASIAASAAAPTDWYEPTVENRPFVRWWWLGSAVDPEGLTYNLEEFAAKGLGGVEITSIYGVKGNEANDIPYLSDKWMEMLTHTTREAGRLGLQVDMNNGTGWPFGGPDVTPDFSARKRVVERFSVEGGKKIKLKIIPSDAKQRPVARLQRVVAVSDKGKRLNLTDKVTNDSVLDCKLPKGGWEIYAVFSGRTFQKVKRAAPGGEGLVLNHYDSIAVKRYLGKFDRGFAKSGAPVPDSFFNDSYEVYGSDWADNIFEEFAADHGYALENYIPEFVNEKDTSDIRRRVVRDYRFTLARMLEDNFTRPWIDWAHAKGARIRNQSHGSPANIIDIYADVDIPECESFGQTDFDIPGLVRNGDSRPSDADPAVLKFASSAAHLTGKRLTSSETLTWLTEHFHTSLARCKPELDQMLCSGVNHVYFHGAPYSPKGVEFPGWMFYASINMSPTNSIWKDAGGLMKYLERTQAFLSAGEPDNDFLLYFPIEDVWYEQTGNPYLMFDIHKMDRRMPDVKRAVNEIISAGYDCDYISDRFVETLTVEPDGRLRTEGGTVYRGLVVPDAKLMEPRIVEKLAALAAWGASVVFAGGMPSDVPGLSRLEARRAEMATALSHLKHAKGVIVAPNIPEGLSRVGVAPELMRRDEGLRMVRRKNEAGGHNYFIANLSDKEVNGFMPLAHSAVSAMIFDPLTGLKGRAEDQTDNSGCYRVRLQLAPGESLLLKTFPGEAGAEAWKYVERKGDPIEIGRGWSISFPESEPPIEETFMTDTLTQWCALPDSLASVNVATGRYTVKFTLDNPADADDWELDLGDVRESARVKVNGREAPTVWSVPFRVRIGELLLPGENQLEIDVTNLQANRIADYERRGIEWRKFKDANIASVTNARKFDFGTWPVAPSGLNSKVTLTPLYLLRGNGK